MVKTSSLSADFMLSSLILVLPKMGADCALPTAGHAAKHCDEISALHVSVLASLDQKLALL
jgi:hypothetical protein